MQANLKTNCPAPLRLESFPPKLGHTDRLSCPLAESDVYEQEQPGLW
jgi:hypothetical protein